MTTVRTALDTAYSNVELPLHTDGTYLEESPGLQLFVCAEQPAPPADRPLDGATKLADGFMAAAVLRADAPVTHTDRRERKRKRPMQLRTKC